MSICQVNAAMIDDVSAISKNINYIYALYALLNDGTIVFKLKIENII